MSDPLHREAMLRGLGGEDVQYVFKLLDEERAAHRQTKSRLQSAAIDKVDDAEARIVEIRRELATARAAWDQERARLVAALTDAKKFSKLATEAWRVKYNQVGKLVLLLRECIGQEGNQVDGVATDGLFDLGANAANALSGDGDRDATAAAQGIIDRVRAAIEPPTDDDDDEKPPPKEVPCSSA